MTYVIAVGSINQTKIDAVRLGFKDMFPDVALSVHGISVPSQVSSQPMSGAEIISGAENRALAVRDQCPDYDYSVGLEAGLLSIGKIWIDIACVVVQAKDGRVGIGCTPGLWVPPRIMNLIMNGMELGDAADTVFKTKNCNTGIGFFGLMTNGIITRTQAYRQGVVMALSRFLHDDLFNN